MTLLAVIQENRCKKLYFLVMDCNQPCSSTPSFVWLGFEIHLGQAMPP